MNQTPHRGKRIYNFTGAPGRGDAAALQVLCPEVGPGASGRGDAALGTAGPRVAPRCGRSAPWLVPALLAGVLAALALALVPAAQAFTGGAASAVPAPIATATSGESTTTPAFDEAELSFTPFRVAGASWYGGKTMWGRSTACGQVLRPGTIGVAHKRLPCGTPVKFVWHHHSIIAPVIDRGPYIRGRAWDLTAAAAEALDFEGVGRIRYAIAIKYASKGP